MKDIYSGQLIVLDSPYNIHRQNMLKKHKTSKYVPHQGLKELAKRKQKEQLS